MTVYVRTNYKKFKVVGTELQGYDGEKPRGRIFLPKEIENIKNAAFETCEGITAVDLSPCTKLLKIEKRAFNGCKKLKSIDLSNCNELISIEGGINSANEAEGAFGFCSNLESVNLSPCTKLEKIGVTAFFQCKKLKNINLSSCDKITSIEMAAFLNCENLMSIDLSNCLKLEKILEETFFGCKNIEIKLPASIAEVKENAFGENNDSYCKKVLVPNDTIKKLVVASGYPQDKVESY